MIPERVEDAVSREDLIPVMPITLNAKPFSATIRK